MAEEEFPGNRKDLKVGEPEAPKKLQKLTTGEVKKRKKPLHTRVVETFIGGEPKVAARTMFVGVLLPAAKDAIFEAITTGVQQLIFGEIRRRPGGAASRVSNYVSYGAQSRRDPSTRPPSPGISRRSRSQFEFEELAIQSRAEAEQVIATMFEILEKYNSVTVADLYELTGIAAKHTDQKWGWVDLRGSQARRLSDGTYLLDLPVPEPLT